MKFATTSRSTSVPRDIEENILCSVAYLNLADIYRTIIYYTNVKIDMRVLNQLKSFFLSIFIENTRNITRVTNLINQNYRDEETSIIF